MRAAQKKKVDKWVDVMEGIQDEMEELQTEFREQGLDDQADELEVALGAIQDSMYALDTVTQ